MKIWTNYGKNWEGRGSLWDAFGLEEKLHKKLGEKKERARRKAYVLAFTGGGGKTSSIYHLAAEGVKRGKTILIMTTTHMLAPREHTVFLKDGKLDFGQVGKKLSEDGVVIVGDKVSGKKMSFVGETVFRELLEMAELILVEADGSRHLPIKVPASYEPVIPSKIDEIISVCGLSCYERRASEVCFRLEEARKIRERYVENLQGDEEWVIREKEIMYLMREGFLAPLREREKGARVSLMLTQADTERLEKVGMDIFEDMGEKGVLLGELPVLAEYGG